VQVGIAVRAPVLRVTVLVLADTSGLPDVDPATDLLDTPFNDVLCQGAEEVDARLRPLRVQARTSSPSEASHLAISIVEIAETIAEVARSTGWTPR
jgi:hypothetical protein